MFNEFNVYHGALWQGTGRRPKAARAGHRVELRKPGDQNRNGTKKKIEQKKNRRILKDSEGFRRIPKDCSSNRDRHGYKGLEGSCELQSGSGSFGLKIPSHLSDIFLISF